MNEIFKEYLDKAKKENKLIAIRSNTDDTDKFSAGFILSISDETISIKAINPHGLPDGIYTIKKSDLYGIDFDDKYLKRLRKRMEESKKLFSDSPSPNFFSDSESNIKTILEKAMDKKQMINVNLYHDLGFYGYIRKLSETEFSIEVFNEFGEYDGISIYLIEDIRNIYWDDIDTREREIEIEKE